MPDLNHFSFTASFDADGVHCPICSAAVKHVDIDTPSYETYPTELVRWSFSCRCELAYQPVGRVLVELWLSENSFVTGQMTELVDMNRATATAVVLRQKTDHEAERGIMYIIRRRPEPERDLQLFALVGAMNPPPGPRFSWRRVWRSWRTRRPRST